MDKFGKKPRVLHGKTDKNHETFFRVTLPRDQYLKSELLEYETIMVRARSRRLIKEKADLNLKFNSMDQSPY